MTHSSEAQAFLTRLLPRALGVGIGGLVLCLLGYWLHPAQFFHSYLLAYLFWCSLTLGCLALAMLHHLVGGAWGALILRLLEAGAGTLPLMIVGFVPLYFGLDALYPWARPEAVATDALLQHKSPYLNVRFFLLRTAVYFAIWLLLAVILSRWSHRREQAAGRPTALVWQHRLRLLSAPGLGLYALTMTFAGVDWVMSLEPYWYSTIYGVLLIVGQILVTLAFAIVVLRQLAAFEPFVEVVTPGHVHDLGNLLLAFVMLWAYMAFSQFLIIWSGNLPEEIPWYLHRTRGGWQVIGVLLLVLHFALPFVLLLARTSKRRVERLATIAVGLVVMHWLELFWLVMPALHPTALHVHWLDLVAPCGVGGFWLVTFIWQLRRHALLPLHDPRLQKVAQHE